MNCLLLYSSDFSVVRESLPDKERSVDHAIYRFGNAIQLCVPVCPFGFICESGDLAVRLQPQLAIGSEISAQLIWSLDKPLQFAIHPSDLNFADRLVGQGLCQGPF